MAMLKTNSPGIHLRRPAKALIVLCALLSCSAVAQLRHDGRLRPLSNSAAGKTPASGPSQKEIIRQWRARLDAGIKTGARMKVARDQLSAQSVLIDEGFEGGTFPPSGWTSVVVTGDPDWAQSAVFHHTGTYSAYSEYSSGAPSQKYLITPRVTLNGLLLYRLTFWIVREFDEPFEPDTVFIKLSTIDSLPPNFTALYACYTGPDTSTDPNIYTRTYRQFTVEFSGVSGTAWLAFDHEDTFGQGISLDDVLLEEVVNNDIASLSVEEPAPGARKNLGAPFQPKATFKNNGVLTQTNIPVRCTIVNGGGTPVYTNTQTIASLAPNVSAQVTFGTFTPSTPGDFACRAVAQNPGDTNPGNDSTAVPFRIPDDVAGTRTVGTGGDFTTLYDAVAYLNGNNVAGPLTFSLIGGSYAEPPLPIDEVHYTTTPQPVIFTPAGGVTPTITISAVSAYPFGIRLKGAGNITFDGSNNGTSSRNLTLVVDTNGFFAAGILVTDGCRNVLVKNMIVKGYSKSDGSANSAIALDTLAVGKRDSNIAFDNLSLMRAFNGIYLNGPAAKSANITISHCEIGAPGANAITQAGIVAYNVDSLLVSGTTVRNLYRYDGVIDLYGLFIGGGCSNGIVSANTIHDVKNKVNSYFAHGVVNDGGAGSNLLCYNNTLYDIASSGAGLNTNFSVGIYSSNPENTGERYYYNSIYLTGHDSSSSSVSSSADFAFADGVSYLQLRNNIFVNGMTFGGSAPGNKAYCILAGTNVWPAGSATNYNDLYATGTQGVVGLMNGVNRITLGNWQAGTGQDGNSISSDPLFIASDDLHIQATGITSPVNNKGTPVAGVADDIDHESRNISAPDIGADEFTPQAGAVIFMSQGWNIVSLPAIPADARKVLLFPTAISKAFAYQGSYLGKDTLVGGTGYWLKFSAAQSVPITGVPHSRDTIDVVAGWNLIGSVDQPIAVLSVLSLTPGLTTSKFFGYAGSYSAADSLYPGRGYWVKANQAGELVLASGGAAAHGAATVRIIPTDEVPPLPPEPSLSTDTPLPERFALGQNYPNPFNPSTVIRYDMPVDGHVTLTVYDVLGQQVASIIDGWQEAGYKSIVISMEGYPSGMYFYRMSAGAFSATKKLLYLK